MSKAAKRMTVVMLLLVVAGSIFFGQFWYHSRITSQLIKNNLYTAEVRQDVRSFHELLIANWVLVLATTVALDRLWARKDRKPNKEL